MLVSTKLSFFFLVFKKDIGSSLAVQQVGDLALSLQCLGSVLWHGFSLWPRSFLLPWVQSKKKKEEDADVVFLRGRY